MKKAAEKHVFLWRESYIDYLWTENVVAPTYFQKEGVLVYEHTQLSAYATVRELTMIQKLGESLFVQDKYADVEKNLLAIAKETEVTRKRYSKQVLRKASNSALFDLYKELFDLMRRFLYYYRYTEPHYLDLLEGKIDQLLEKQEKNKEKREYLKAKLLAGVDVGMALEQEIKQIIQFLREISKKRFEAKRNSLITTHYADALLEETARRFYLAVTQVSSLNYRELKDLLLKDIKPDINNANKRKEAFALKVNGTEFIEITDKQFIDFRDSFMPTQTGRTIKGSTAYPGRVTGKAVVLPSIVTTEEYEQFIEDFERGGILVAPMTSPELVPVFKDVAAIVTDEGGITSHAALIAREMKIPCIVGTSYATKTLKTGMQLLVDATNAEVSII
ncbi:MAG: hypothetical protein HYZ61_01875 [Candidatus Andersenbacteria bacterium]|nr:hypothetical protein [Candidatus Andersenbacteria bacterium]